ncbi:M20 family metallopeptidase [Moorella sp. Hama-1]|uniref:M20 family metallopeptidase n=1 Tax=Moorella sp. Hama-1 TaxID=2138101 RepID=UPI00137ABA8A|nr:M20 family metallopeptidase [Moorella sp. Hama-1]BCV20303.1 peptidase M20 [Moorella sp. Hama-1]
MTFTQQDILGAINMVRKNIPREEVIALLQRLIREDTTNPPGNEERAGRVLAGWMQKWGIETTLDFIEPGRPNVTGVLKGYGNRPSLLFNGHLDTVPAGQVPWQYDPFAGQIVGNRVYGRGSSDMKGGLAAIAGGVVALSLLKTSLAGDVMVLATVGEEVDSLGARAFKRIGNLAKIGGLIIAEPTGLELVVAEKGALWVELAVYGRTSHSAHPEAGINAVEHMIKLLDYLKQDSSCIKSTPPLFQGPTTSLTTIHGGVKANLIPDYCAATIDIRTLPGQKHTEVENELRAKIDEYQSLYPGLSVKMRIVNNRPPVATGIKDELVTLSQKIGENLWARQMEAKGVSYYTDASVFVEGNNIPFIILGPGEETQAHQPDEYVVIDNVLAAAEFYAVLALLWCGRG